MDTSVQGFGLSLQQETLWRSIAAVGPAPFRSLALIQVSGGSDPERLARAASQVLGNCEILRTGYARLPGMELPLQVIAPEPPEVRRIDLSTLDAERLRGRLDFLFYEASCAVPDLSGPVAQVTVATLPRQEMAVLLAVPSLCADAQSLEIFVHLLERAYHAMPAEPSTQYVDFADWQRTRPAKPLPAGITTLSLPFEMPGAGPGRFEPRFVSVDLNPELFHRLRTIAGDHDLHIESVTLAAWSTLLCRLSGSTEPEVKCVLPDREHPSLRTAVGMFERLVSRRFSMDLQSSLMVPASLSSTPAAMAHPSADDIAFEFREAWAPAESDVPQTASGPRFALIRAYDCSRPFKLELRVLCRGGVRLEFHFDSLRFATADISRLSRQYVRLLESFADHPETSLIGLRLLTDSELEQIVTEFNAPVARDPQWQLVTQLFSIWAHRLPEQIALAEPGRTMTYREADLLSNGLAAELRKLGVNGDAIAGVAVERSIDAVLAILAVLKTGAAYLPIDPDLPDKRIRSMLEQARAQVVICRSGQMSRFDLPGIIPVDVGCATPGTALDIRIEPDHLAYVIFTSGSTGQPKGVGVEHRNLAHYVNALLSKLDLPHGASYAMVSTLAADLGHTVLFGALCGGGTLHLLPDSHVTDSSLMDDYCRTNQFDCMKIVPSHLTALLDAGASARVLPRRRLVLGGEACRWDLVRRVRTLAPECVVLNHYGPTETTVGVCTYRVEGLNLHDAETVPLGRPLGQNQVFVLDERRFPVPVWTQGEIWITGAGVARGYIGQPELTDERFTTSVDIPGWPQSRFYRTGDRGRLLPDGNIEFLGRFDHQVKIRGHRVELGEVEAAMGRLSGVQAAVVVVEVEPDSRLVAYYTGSLSPGRIRELLAADLPAVFVPSAIVQLDTIPLNTNGKIDRTRLPRTAPAVTDAGPMAMTPVQEVIAMIFEDLLGVTGVGPTQSFIELGGHSLKATQAVSRIRRAFGVAVSLRYILQHPTVSELSEYVSRLRAEGAAFPSDIHRADSHVMSPAQERQWFLYCWQPDSPVYNVFAGFQIHGDLNRQALESSIQTIVLRHETLRTAFLVVDGRPVPKLLSPESFQLRVATGDPSAGAVAAEEVRRPFRLESEPPLRVTLIPQPDGSHLLVVAMHHIASDGWSLGVFYRELAVLYSSRLGDTAPDLAEPPVRYRDYARWMRDRSESDSAELAFWKTRLNGLSTLEFPVDFTRPAVQGFSGRKLPLRLRADQTEKLRAFGRKRNTTLYMTLLAGWQALLSRYSGQTDIAVGSPIANRNRTEVEGLIGFFANTLVLRGDVSGDPSFADLVERVRQTTLDAYDHQDVPFERVVETLNPARDLSRSPLFQVMFVLQNAPSRPLSLPGLNIAPVELDAGTSKFDLSLVLLDEGDSLSGFLEYRTDLFRDDTIRRLASHYENLMAHAVSEPEDTVSELRLMSAAERRLILDVWCGSTSDYPRELAIHEVFDSAVRRYAGRTALECGGTVWTYMELDREASVVAQRLQAVGVPSGARVGVQVDRSAELVAAFLGILKAGCSYVPLDSRYPQARRSYIVEDSGVTAVIGLGHLPFDVPAGVRYVDLHGPLPECPPLAEVHGDSGREAYVMYTSGSTGQPKGVAVTHRGVVRLVCDNDYAELNPHDRILQFAPATFDASTFEIWGALLNGATLVILPQAQPSLEDLGSFVRERRVSTMWLTASLFAEMVRYRMPDLTGLRQLLAGGDVLPPDAVRRFITGHPGCRLINGYGPTENTTFTACHSVVPADLDRGSVPIGSPIRNTFVYILDDRLEPVPAGVVGELYAGGDGVAAGYVNNDELTRGKFIANPFRQGDRLYRTGDRARFLGDGVIEFAGRIDEQVKLRGFRVEPGEVSAALLASGLVSDATVFLWRSGTDARLLAAVVSADTALQPERLREHLRQTLPDYMIPSVFVSVPRLPLTPHGKVDRDAILKIASEMVTSRSEDSSACSSTERALQRVWRDLLDGRTPDVSENFFEIGAHSLLMLQAHARISELFPGRNLTIVDLFQYATIRSLGAFLDSHAPASDPGSQARGRGERQRKAFQRRKDSRQIGQPE